MRYSFDLHVHSWFSSDATDPPEKLISSAREKGLDGIAITDHNSIKAHLYCQQHGLSRPDGLPLNGFLIVPGVEISSADGHILCLGCLPEGLTGSPAAHVFDVVHSMGGIAVPAHPFDRWRHGLGREVLDSLGKKLEAIEVFNAAVSSKSYNEKASAYAAHHSLAGLAGSDAHHASAVGFSYTSFELPTLSTAELIAAIRKGGTTHCRYLTPLEALKKHFANLFRTPPPEDLTQPSPPPGPSPA